FPDLFFQIADELNSIKGTVIKNKLPLKENITGKFETLFLYVAGHYFRSQRLKFIVRKISFKKLLNDFMNNSPRCHRIKVFLQKNFGKDLIYVGIIKLTRAVYESLELTGREASFIGFRSQLF